MSSLRDQLHALHAHPGVRAVVAAGRDGLLIDRADGDGAGDDGADALAGAEHLAALAPGLVAAAERLTAADGGGLRSVVVESADALLVALPVSDEVTVLVAIDPAHADAASSLGRVRGERGALAGAV